VGFDKAKGSYRDKRSSAGSRFVRRAPDRPPSSQENPLERRPGIRPAIQPQIDVAEIVRVIRGRLRGRRRPRNPPPPAGEIPVPIATRARSRTVSGFSGSIAERCVSFARFVPFFRPAIVSASAFQARAWLALRIDGEAQIPLRVGEMAEGQIGETEIEEYLVVRGPRGRGTSRARARPRTSLRA